MAGPEAGLVRSWLKRAGSDLATARLLVEAGGPLDTAIYHCQQSAEKALKAYLLFQGMPAEKTHNLTLLVERCAEQDGSFKGILAKAATLTPYATAYRYPGEFFEQEPTLADVREAMGLAEKYVHFVLERMPEEYHPKDGPGVRERQAVYGSSVAKRKMRKAVGRKKK